MALSDHKVTQLYLTALTPDEIFTRAQRIRELYEKNDFTSPPPSKVDRSLLCPDCGGNKLPDSVRCFLCYRGDKTTPRTDLRTTRPCVICGSIARGGLMCKICHLISWRIVNEDHVDPKTVCPDCKGRKSRKGLRCRVCDWKTRGIDVVSITNGYTSDRKKCNGCGKRKTRPTSSFCKSCITLILKPPGYVPDGRCKDCRKKVKNRAVRCRKCKDTAIARHLMVT